MNWSGKVWALQNKDGTLALKITGNYPMLFPARWDARWERKHFRPETKVVRVQVDVKVIE